MYEYSCNKLFANTIFACKYFYSSLVLIFLDILNINIYFKKCQISSYVGSNMRFICKFIMFINEWDSVTFFSNIV